MNLYKHYDTKLLYTLEHLVHDIYHLNGNANAGYYAYPYKHDGEILKHLCKNSDTNSENFLHNFEKISEL